eukprot:jgi/Pico_ML_1/52661/g3336.t2
MATDTSVEPTFNDFLDKMAHPSAVDLVRSMKRNGTPLLSAKIGALDFVKPSNLEIPPRYWDESSWVLAQKELQNAQAPPGADDFFPLLVYTIIRANPPRLESNLQFVSRFRKADRLVSETAYFFTHFVSATSFLETLDATSLVGVDPAAFLRSMHRAGFPVSEDALAGTGRTLHRGTPNKTA